MKKLMSFGTIMIVAASLQGNAAEIENTDNSVKLRVLAGRPVLDDVYLNGKGPFRFLLDTGAQTNQVDANLAQQLNLAPSFRVEMLSAAGAVQVPGGRVAEVSLGIAGAASADDQEFLFTNLEGVHALSSSIQGVLGQEFLSRFDYLLDLRGKRLTFDSPVSEGLKIPVERIDGRMAIRTGDGQLVLDSGTNVAIFFRSTAPNEKLVTINTNAGTAAAQSVYGLRMQLGGQEYRLQEAAVVSRLDSREDGLLPLCLFQSIFISNSEGYIVIEPGKRQKQTTSARPGCIA